jgi:general secretion pathway protein L
MTSIDDIRKALATWIDIVAARCLVLLERFIAPRKVTLIEEAEGTFVVSDDERTASATPIRFRLADSDLASTSSNAAAQLDGTRVEFILQANKFLFRQLELPNRAVEFLDGVIRAQIDRLTPWTVRDAAFGWGKPLATANDRVALTVAATARSLLLPYVEAARRHGAATIAIFAVPQDAARDSEPIKILEQSGRGVLDVERLRVLLIMVIGALSATAAAATAAAFIGGVYLDAQHDALSAHLAELRSTLRSGADPNGIAITAIRRLETKKREVPASVIVLEALSKILPDSTYLTELHLDGNKLQIVGQSHDAPLLIHMIEDSPYFARAIFFAPTTRSAGTSGEQFHIETTVQSMVRSGT